MEKSSGSQPGMGFLMFFFMNVRNGRRDFGVEKEKKGYTLMPKSVYRFLGESKCLFLCLTLALEDTGRGVCWA